MYCKAFKPEAEDSAIFGLRPLPTGVKRIYHPLYDEEHGREHEFQMTQNPADHLDAGNALGCQICLIFRSHFNDEQLGEWRGVPDWDIGNYTSFTVRHECDAGRRFFQSSLYHGLSMSIGSKKVFDDGFDDGHQSIFPEKIYSKYLRFVHCDQQEIPSLVARESDSGSQTSMEFARNWLQDCELNHPQCQRHDARTCPTPNRLIYLGSATTLHTKLFEHAPDGTRYATLSHCWGGTVPIRLLKSNLEDFQRHIPLLEFQKTFRDALQVAQSLGIEYIWIDSLCIIQDFPDDWAKEAASMHSVYSNAVVNIVAADAENSDDGLFRKRDPGLVQPCLFQMPDKICENNAVPVLLVNENIRSEVSNNKVAKRAWCTQEVLLSARNLSFLPSTLAKD
ncbi:hypothetical protein D0Z07_4326 [Hyphodiscus hymeniophilus]|uniref:Heterokaryon incompatibility domain-containing protein n=1 Tax=Hyphodiscus hymeniophilus TaxID=353542 RepID=A0A9P7AXI3_9HELO|nr:hypothetical protein D0Z07_4326 [Hyphodiscus hymeniophilus]